MIDQKRVDTNTFLGWVNEIIKWNAVARNGEHDFSEETIKNQIDYTVEEIKETMSACLNGDKVMLIDGVADVLVTLAYLSYLKCHHGESDFTESLRDIIAEQEGSSFAADRRNTDHVLMWCGIALHDVTCDGAPYGITRFCLVELLDIMNEILVDTLGIDVIGGVEEVLRSNWSKFPKSRNYLTDESLLEECRAIEQSRSKSDISAIPVMNDGEEYMVFRDKLGKGKIAKPTTFSEAELAQFVPA